MEENLKNKLGLITFIIVVLFLAIGGYFFMKYVVDGEIPLKNTSDKINYKLDNSKDYIYFENEKIISEEAEISFKDVRINLNTQEVLEESLNSETARYLENIQYISKSNLMTNEIVNYDNDDLYALTFRNYEAYEFDKYVSLLIKDYNYSCFDFVTFKNTKSYIFDTTTGKILSNEEIMDLYNVKLDDIKAKVRTDLENSQATENGIEIIKIDETIDNLDDLAFYITDYGRLNVSYLVKSTQEDYNKVTEVK